MQEYQWLDDEKTKALLDFYRRLCDKDPDFAKREHLRESGNFMIDFFLQALKKEETYVDLDSKERFVPLGSLFLSRHFPDVPETNFYLLGLNNTEDLERINTFVSMFDVDEQINLLEYDPLDDEWLQHVPDNISGVTAFGTREKKCLSDFWKSLYFDEPGKIDYNDIVRIAPKIILADYGPQIVDNLEYPKLRPHYINIEEAETGLRHAVAFSNRIR